MKPAPFDYCRPSTVTEALEALNSTESSRVLAGGQSLIPAMNFRLTDVSLLVDIGNVAGLDAVACDPGGVTVGAAATQTQVLDHDGAASVVGGLRAALRHVGHLQIRNRGTVCGSLAHCDPLAELPAVALALEAELVLTSVAGERRVPAHDFFVADMTTCIEPGEIVSAVAFKRQDPSERSALLEVSNGGNVFPVGGVALRWASAGGTCAMARIAAFGVGSVAQRLVDAEDALVGTDLGPEAIAASVAAARNAVNPTGDMHADADYRRHLVGVLIERGLLEGEGP